MTDPDHTTDQFDSQDAQRYDELMRSINDELEKLEKIGDESVQLSNETQESVKKTVRATVTHGSQLKVGKTSEGPFTISELALRSLVRDAVDDVDGVRSVKTHIQYDDTADEDQRSLALPSGVNCEIAVKVNQDADGDSAVIPNFQRSAKEVTQAVSTALADNLDITGIDVRVHIADLYFAPATEGGQPKEVSA